MKKLVYLFVSLFLVVIAAENVNAQTEATATATATALIIKPITISNTLELDFGILVPSGTNGTVTVPASGMRTSSDVGFIGNEPDYSAASFTVTGEKDYTFSLTLPENNVVKLKSGSNEMAVNTFTTSIGLIGNSIANSGTSFTVGATLSVDAAQTAGEYTGEFDVTVAYE